MSTQHSFYYAPINPDDLYFFYKWNSKSAYDEKQIIEGCFSIFYADGIFLESINNVLVEYGDTGVEGCWWYYPDLSSPYPDDVFEGVCFEIGFDNPATEVYVSEQVSFEYAKKACERFLEVHPTYRDHIKQILNNWEPLKTF